MTGHPRALGRRPPGTIPLRRGLVLSPGAPFRGMLMGPEAFFGTAGRMWVSVLRPDPSEKRSCAILVNLVGGI